VNNTRQVESRRKSTVTQRGGSKKHRISFQLSRQEQYIRREIILLYGVEEAKYDADDGEKILFSVADKFKIDLHANDVQGGHRRGPNKGNKKIPFLLIARFVSCKKETSSLQTNKISKYQTKTERLCLRRPYSSQAPRKKGAAGAPHDRTHMSLGGP